MNWNWNYENYTKAIIPLVLALVALLQGWVESGVLERAEISNVIYLAAVALLVFIAPNVKLDKTRNAPQARRTAPETRPTNRRDAT